MKDVIIIGSGIAGMRCAVECAEQGLTVSLVAPFPSERSQSVMAAGGINAVTAECESGDSIDSHIADTLKGGCNIAGLGAVEGLCKSAADIIDYLEGIGTVFSRDNEGKLAKRDFGGQSHKRTHYCGAATGKLIVSALVMEVRRYEAEGLIERRMWSCFYSALIRDGVCYGTIVFDETKGGLDAIYGKALVMATGGQNGMMGKTTGSTQCDGYAAGKLFLQGVELKNLEFIQYHPTTIETDQKKMLITEAVRGEGGRLFYMDGDKRVYFMEEKYGKRGNLQTRDVVSREIYMSGRQVYLDISFLPAREIKKKLPEVMELCQKYRGIDITKEPIPVTPSVHFFMGGIAVDNNHMTNIDRLYAIGECASIYHGANRLGGNSLLAAMYSGKVAADDIGRKLATDASGKMADAAREMTDASGKMADFEDDIEVAKFKLSEMMNGASKFPVQYIRDLLAETMNKELGIVRDEKSLSQGIEDVKYYISISKKIKYDNSVLAYFNYSLEGILALARATLECAYARKESRGAHYRSDYSDSDKAYEYATIISYDDGAYAVRLDKEKKYES